MAYEQPDKKNDSVYSKRIKAGKRRTYFFDVKATRGNDYFLTITESRKRFNDDGYDRHKIFLYKEDFNKFLKGLTEAVDYVKTDLMPDFDFDAFNHEGAYDEEKEYNAEPATATVAPAANASEADATAELAQIEPLTSNGHGAAASNDASEEEVDKW